MESVLTFLLPSSSIPFQDASLGIRPFMQKGVQCWKAKSYRGQTFLRRFLQRFYRNRLVFRHWKEQSYESGVCFHRVSRITGHPGWSDWAETQWDAATLWSCSEVHISWLWCCLQHGCSYCQFWRRETGQWWCSCRLDFGISKPLASLCSSGLGLRVYQAWVPVAGDQVCSETSGSSFLWLHCWPLFQIVRALEQGFLLTSQSEGASSWKKTLWSSLLQLRNQ